MVIFFSVFLFWKISRYKIKYKKKNLAEGDAFTLEIQMACMVCASMIPPEPGIVEVGTAGELLLRIKL